jgi:HEAT repeat protein
VRPLAQAAALLAAGTLGWVLARTAIPAGRSAAASPAPSVASANVPGVPTPVAPPDLGSNPRLSNVSYEPAGPDGKVAVAFDVTTRRAVSGSPDDPEVAKLLAYLVAHNAETAGEKSRAIQLVTEHYGTGHAAPSPEIVAALTNTLKKDANPGVRKKAADALASLTMTPEIRAAFLDSLRSDKNPGVRLVAVDALAAAAKQSPDANTIESLREKAVDPQENGFVRAKAASALKAISF